MPKLVRPANSELAEDPIKAFGSLTKAGIIGYLRAHPASTRAETARALQVQPITVSRALTELLEVGLVSADPPRMEAERGEWVRYTVNASEVTELYLRLGLALGEI
ncbi:hypothetical protein [Microbacterium sp.]|uniref:hypothetical protein n=1 Tax=Microbacterium sp. TaxID=51671 RepID=UPI003F717986